MNGQRCPHDGGFCHHACTATCDRKADGSHLTTPHEGFPIDSDAPVPCEHRNRRPYQVCPDCNRGPFRTT